MTELVFSEAGGSGELATPAQLFDFTENWLANRRFSEHTRAAYRRDVRQWLSWCALMGLDPLRVRFTDVNAWGRTLEAPDEGKPMKAATVARKMSAVSSWYAFLVKLGALQANPASVADRPEVDRDFSATVSFDHEDAKKMLMVATRQGDEHIGLVAPVLAGWLVELGTRAGETAAVLIRDLGYERGFRVVDMREMKGNRRRRRLVPPPLGVLVDEYLVRRAAAFGGELDVDDHLFVGVDGEPLTRHDIYRFVQRLARAAGLPNARRITPHSFRHAWNGTARRRGAALEDRQRAMGHRDPRTTRRYDANADEIERDPSLLVAAAVAWSEPQERKEAPQVHL